MQHDAEGGQVSVNAGGLDAERARQHGDRATRPKRGSAPARLVRSVVPWKCSRSITSNASRVSDTIDPATLPPRARCATMVTARAAHVRNHARR